MMKKLSLLFFAAIMVIMAGCGGGNKSEADEGANALKSVIDAVISGKQSDIADEMLGQTAQEIRDYFVYNAKDYYMQSGIFTEEQCQAVAEKMISSTARLVTYRIEPSSQNQDAFTYTVYLKTVDPDVFSLKYTELSEAAFAGVEISDEEKAALAYDIYMESLDYLTASDEERALEITLNHESNWNLTDTSAFLSDIFGIMIGS